LLFLANGYIISQQDMFVNRFLKILFGKIARRRTIISYTVPAKQKTRSVGSDFFF